MHHRLLSTLGLVLAGILLSLATGPLAETASAEQIHGLTVDGRLFSFDSESPGTTTSPVPITGLATGLSLVGIDVRPVNGQLYGLAFSPRPQASGSDVFCLYKIDPVTAVATAVGFTFSRTVNSTPSASDFAFDFDPVADRARVISSCGCQPSSGLQAYNFLVRPSSGRFLSAGQSPAYTSGPDQNAPVSLVAMAYSNNFFGATQSTLYGFNRSREAFVTVGGPNGNPSPNTGTLFTFATFFGIPASTSIGLDISGTTGLGYMNVDYFTGTTTGLFDDHLVRLNPANGAASAVGKIGAGMQVLDIAVKQNAPATLPEQTLTATNLPQDLYFGTTRFEYTATQFEEVPYARTISVYVEVLNPSPTDVKISVFRGAGDVRTAGQPGGPIGPVVDIWDHDPLVDDNHEPVLCADPAGGLKPCIRIVRALPEFAEVDLDQLGIQVQHDIPGSAPPSQPAVGKLTKARVTLNGAPHPPPALQLYGGALNQPLPTTVNRGEPLDLLMTASAASSYQLDRLSLAVRQLQGFPAKWITIASEQKLTSGSAGTLGLSQRYLPPGDYEVVAKAYDNTGIAGETTSSLRVNRRGGIFRILNPVRTPPTPMQCGACQDASYSATLELKNAGSVPTGNLRVRLLEVASASFLDYMGTPTLPEPVTPGNAAIGPVSPLAANATQLVHVGCTVRRAIVQPAGVSTRYFNFHVYALLEEQDPSGDWVSIDSELLVHGDYGHAPPFNGGPGSGENDPPPATSGTQLDAFALEAVGVRADNAVANRFIASVTYRNSKAAVTKDLVPEARLVWRVLPDESAATIDSLGVLHPKAIPSPQTIQVRAEFTFAAETRGASMPVTLPATVILPVITSPTSATGTQGQLFTYQITATGNPTSFGASGLPGGLSVNASSGVISGTPTQPVTAAATIFAANGSGTASQPLSITIVPAPPGPAKLINISTRGVVSTGDAVMIGGFAIRGTQPKRVLIRAVGPSLTAQGVPNVLADPTMSLHGAGQTLAANDDWTLSADQQAIIASGFAPSDPKEPAIVRTLDPGNYTAIVRGAFASTGIGLVEVYDLDQSSGSKLINISTRGLVSTGDAVMIGGFAVRGGQPKRVLIRAVGPSLTDQGVPNVLLDPTMSLHGGGQTLATNDDWNLSTDQQAIIASGFAPSDPKEPAIVRTLDPGDYTAIVRGTSGSTGIGLVEVYELE